MKNCISCTEHMEENASICASCGYDQNGYSSQPHQLVPGTMLKDRYFVGKVMGEGGFGITYVGRDLVLDRKVAIKEFYMSGYVTRNSTVSLTVTPNQGKTESLVLTNKNKFITEARALAKFTKEDGIVDVLDFFEENETAYIIMEFLPGRTLKEHVKATGNLTEDEAYRLIKPVLDALEDVHKTGLIHRDISPDNIMLMGDGKVKLLDFGAARDVSGDDTKSLSVILKPGYAPEEQYRTRGNQGPWTDVYALCATLYYCISGVIPDNSMERLFEDNLEPLCVAAPRCSKAFSDAIENGMAVRSKDRFQNVSELKEALEAALRTPQDDNETVYVGGHSETTDAPKEEPRDDNETVYVGKQAENTAADTPKEAQKEAQKEVSKTAQKEEPTKDNETVYVGKQAEITTPNRPKKMPIIIGGAVAALILIMIIIGIAGKSDTKAETDNTTQNEEVQDTVEDTDANTSETSEPNPSEETVSESADEETAISEETDTENADETAALSEETDTESTDEETAISEETDTESADGEIVISEETNKDDTNKGGTNTEDTDKAAKDDTKHRPDCLIDSSINKVEFTYSGGGRPSGDVLASYRPSESKAELQEVTEPFQMGHPLWTYPLVLAKWQRTGKNAIDMDTIINPGYEFVNLGVCREGEDGTNSFIYVDVINDTKEAVPLSDCILCGVTAVADKVGNDTFFVYSREHFINISFDSSEEDVISIKKHGLSKKYSGEVILDYGDDYGKNTLASYNNYDFKVQVYGGTQGLPIECIRITTQMNNKSIND